MYNRSKHCNHSQIIDTRTTPIQSHIPSLLSSYVFVNDINENVSTMATSALLDADFGSESEDDNFNPAPADVSDNDAIGESDTEDAVRSNGYPSEQPRPANQGVGHERDEKHGEQSRRRSRDDGNSENVNGAHDVNGDGETGTGVGDRDVDDEEEEEDEDEEDEDDDEEAVSVSWRSTKVCKCITDRANCTYGVGTSA